MMIAPKNIVENLFSTMYYIEKKKLCSTFSAADLSTFEKNFKGYTQHGGNGAAWATTAGTAANAANYVNKRNGANVFST